MNKIKSTIIKILQEYKQVRLNALKSLRQIFSSRTTVKFIIWLLVVLLMIITGLIFKIVYFEVFIYYYLLLLSIYILNTNLWLNKYFNVVFSEYNIIIKLTIPMVVFVLVDYNQILIGFCKFALILAIRSCFTAVLGFSATILLLALCLCSGYIIPIISLCLFEYSLYMNPENTNGSDQHSLPNWYSRAQEEQNFWEHQKNLQEMLKNTEHGINYKELVPQDINDFNIAKANNALEALQKDLVSFYGHVKTAGLGSEIIQKIRNSELVSEGSSVHNKLTYEQLAVLKHFGKRLNLHNLPGYNGILQNGPFTNTEPNNIEIPSSIYPNGILASRLESEMSNHKGLVKDYIAATNNKTYNID